MNSGNILSVLVPIIIIVVLAIAVSQIVRTVRRSIRRASNRLIGGVTSTLVRSVMNQTTAATQDTPRSITNLENMYLPMIKRKYPDLEPDDLRNRAGIVLKEFLDSVHTHTPTAGFMDVASKSLCESVRILSGAKYCNRPFLLHKAAISSFDTNRIGFDLAFKSDTQRKATIIFCYMKDDDNQRTDTLEKHCESCGAVLNQQAQSTGHCPYCDTVFRVVNDFDWLAVKVTVD